MHKHTSTEIKLHQKSRQMEISFAGSRRFVLSHEFLRVYSPSAEVRGHGAGQEVLQVGKKNVDIAAIEPLGSYAVQARFSDGHDSGLHSSDYLYDLGMDQNQLWRQYLQRVQAAGACRAPGATPAAAPKSGCH
jgi:DUF971 family protein